MENLTYQQQANHLENGDVIRDHVLHVDLSVEGREFPDKNFSSGGAFKTNFRAIKSIFNPFLIILGIIIGMTAIIIGSLGNFLSIIIFKKLNKEPLNKNQKSMNNLLLSLAYVDFITATFMAPVNVSSYIQRQNPFNLIFGVNSKLSRYLCSWQAYFYYNCGYISCVHMTVITINRFIGIVLPQNYAHYNHHTKFWVGLSWILSPVLLLPYFFLKNGGFKFNQNQSLCVFDVTSFNQMATNYMLFLRILFQLMTNLIMIICYILIYRKMRIIGHNINKFRDRESKYSVSSIGLRSRISMLANKNLNRISKASLALGSKFRIASVRNEELDWESSTENLKRTTKFVEPEEKLPEIKERNSYEQMQKQLLSDQPVLASTPQILDVNYIKNEESYPDEITRPTQSDYHTKLTAQLEPHPKSSRERTRFSIRLSSSHDDFKKIVESKSRKSKKNRNSGGSYKPEYIENDKHLHLDKNTRDKNWKTWISDQLYQIKKKLVKVPPTEEELRVERNSKNLEKLMSDSESESNDELIHQASNTVEILKSSKHTLAKNLNATDDTTDLIQKTKTTEKRPTSTFYKSNETNTKKQMQNVHDRNKKILKLATVVCFSFAILFFPSTAIWIIQAFKNERFPSEYHQLCSMITWLREVLDFCSC